MKYQGPHMDCDMRIDTLKKEIKTLQAERDKLRDALVDIRAKVKEIKYHHSKPWHSRHSNTIRICQEIIDHINYNLKGTTDKQLGPYDYPNNVIPEMDGKMPIDENGNEILIKGRDK